MNYNMDYELAKQLKDAGFPQGRQGVDDGYLHDGDLIGDDDLPYVPTLSELIEACGERILGFSMTCHLDDSKETKWCADSRTEPCYCDRCEEKLKENPDYFNVNWKYEEGKTPEEAVAKLWLELNKK